MPEGVSHILPEDVSHNCSPPTSPHDGCKALVCAYLCMVSFMLTFMALTCAAYQLGFYLCSSCMPLIALTCAKPHSQLIATLQPPDCAQWTQHGLVTPLEMLTVLALLQLSLICTPAIIAPQAS